MPSKRVLDALVSGPVQRERRLLIEHDADGAQPSSGPGTGRGTADVIHDAVQPQIEAVEAEQAAIIHVRREVGVVRDE